MARVGSNEQQLLRQANKKPTLCPFRVMKAEKEPTMTINIPTSAQAWAIRASRSRLLPVSVLAFCLVASDSALSHFPGHFGESVVTHPDIFMVSRFGDLRAGMLALAVVVVLGAHMIHCLNRQSTNSTTPLKTARAN